MMQEERRGSFVGIVVVTSLAINVGFMTVNETLQLPFFMDSIGTAITAASAGLVPGIIVAVSTNLLLEVYFGFHGASWPFFICGVATVLIIRAFVKAKRFSSVRDALLVSILVGLANAVLGGIIASFLFGGLTSIGLDYLVAALVTSGRSLVSAAFLARIPVNLIDKAIAVFAAYFLMAPIEQWRIRRVKPGATERSQPL
jgi:energy-coupling factor transport system substrate-specific component